MKISRRGPRTALGGLALAALWGCGPGEEPRGEPEPVVLAPIWLDGQRTLNDRCPVRLSALNPRIPPVLVNGRPIGFC
jgi:hypothetical protein